MSLQENTPPLVAIIVKIAFGLVTPKSFFSLILFLVAWGVVGLAVDFVAVLILTAVFGRR